MRFVLAVGGVALSRESNQQTAARLKIGNVPPKRNARMPYEVTLHTTDGELKLPLPEDLADRLHLRDGDRVHLVETAQGLMIVPHDDEFAAAMDVYEEGVATYEAALRVLADPDDRSDA